MTTKQKTKQKEQKQFEFQNKTIIKMFEKIQFKQDSCFEKKIRMENELETRNRMEKKNKKKDFFKKIEKTDMKQY